MKPIIKALKTLTTGTLKTLGKILLAILITSPITYLSVKEAYATRGYFAIGGEWLLMIGMVALVLWLTDKKRHSKGVIA